MSAKAAPIRAATGRTAQRAAWSPASARHTCFAV